MVTKRKRHSDAEIAAKLRQADALANEGKLQSDIARILGVSVMTYHRWRKSGASPSNSRAPAFAASEDRVADQDRTERIRELKVENARLRGLVADLLLEKVKLEEKLSEQYAARGATQRASQR